MTSAPTPTPHYKPLLRALPLLLVLVTFAQIGLSGCPSGGTTTGDGATTGSQGQGVGDGQAAAPAAPTAHQARGLDASGMTIDLRFLAKVDPSSAAESTHYQANGGQSLQSVEVLADGRTVRLIFDALLLPGRDTLDVSGVRSLDGRNFTAASDIALSSGDRTPPSTTLVALEAVPGLDNDLLVVTFNDFMLEDEVLDMDKLQLQYPTGTLFPLQSGDASYDSEKRRLTVSLHDPSARSFDLVLGGNWTLSLSGLHDLGGNAITPGYSISGVVSGDSLAPEVLAVTQNSLVAVDGTIVDVTANEDLEMSSSVLPVNFQFSNGANVVFSDGTESGDMVRLTLDRAVTPGVDTLTVLGLADPAGNRLSPAVTLAIETNDGTPPTVAGLTGLTSPGWFNDSITVAFDERVHPTEAVDPQRFALESPPGTPIDLGEATLTYDPVNWATTITLSGDYSWQLPALDQARRLALLGGENQGDNFGAAVAGIGDQDGDGFDDFLVGATHFDLPSINAPGAVYVYSGRSGNLIRRVDGPLKQAHFGESLAALGDLNGDGIEDFLVGAPEYDTAADDKAGALFVHSGADGSLLLQVDGAWQGQKLGEYVARAGDVNGDQIPDLLAGMPKEDFQGRHSSGLVQVYSGADGSLLHEWGGDAQDDRAGEALIGGFDLDLDGHADILFGADHADTALGNDTGVASVYSGATGALLLRLEGAAKKDRFGKSVAVVGDLDQDQRPDFAIGAYHADAGNLDKAGAVLVFSGADGSLLYRIDGLDKKDEFGTALASGQDFDGDGVWDLLIGAPKVDNGGDGDDDDDDDEGAPGLEKGAAYVHSGIDGSLLRTYLNPTDKKDFGMVLAWAGDFDRDGHSELLFGAENATHGGHSKAGQTLVEAARADLPYTVAVDAPDLHFGDAFQLTVDGMRDLAGNLMPAALVETAILGGDYQMPIGTTMVQNLWADASGATVDIHFQESLDLLDSPSAAFQASNPAATLLSATLRDQGTTLRLVFDAPLTPGSSTIQVTNLQDPAGNLLPIWSDTVLADLGTVPALVGSTATLMAGGQEIQIQLAFQDPALEWDAVSAARWTLQLQGVSFALDTANFRYEAQDRILTISFTPPATAQVGDGFQLTASGLRDPFGNLAASLQQTGTISAE